MILQTASVSTCFKNSDSLRIYSHTTDEGHCVLVMYQLCTSMTPDGVR